MADQNRTQSNQRSNQNPPRQPSSGRDDQSTQQTQGTPNPGHSLREDSDDSQSVDRGRSQREPASVANDREPRERDQDRKNFSGDRESDNLGSEMDIDSNLSEDDDEIAGGRGRSDR
jgi:hypothetical protein